MYGLVSPSSLDTSCLDRYFDLPWILRKAYKSLVCLQMFESQIFEEYGNRRKTLFFGSLQSSTALTHFSWLSIPWSVMHAQLSCSKTVVKAPF